MSIHPAVERHLGNEMPYELPNLFGYGTFLSSARWIPTGGAPKEPLADLGKPKREGRRL